MTQARQDLIIEIYNTVADDSRWPRVLDRIAAECGAIGGIVFDAEWRDEAAQLTTPYFSTGYEDALIAQFIERFHDEEFAVQRDLAARLQPTDEVEVFTEDLVASAHPVRAGGSVLWLKSLGISAAAACFLDKDDPTRSRFSLQFAAGAADAAGMARLRALLPHIAKAMELGRPAAQLARQHSRLLNAMNRLRVGMCILDNAGRVVVENEEFARQAQDYGVFRIGQDKRLQMRAAADQRKLADLAGRIDLHGRFGARPRREAIVTAAEGGAPALCIEITPLDAHDEIGSALVDGAILYSLDTSRPMAANMTAVAAAFALTAAETGLIELISEGLTNAEIAERRERSVETINAQVKSILAKTSCANRTQLVRLISGFAPAILRTV